MFVIFTRSSGIAVYQEIKSTPNERLLGCPTDAHSKQLEQCEIPVLTSFKCRSHQTF